MNIWKISILNLKSKPISTFLSIFVLSLSIALLLGVHQLKTSFKNQIDSNLGKIDLVIGAKGSPLQLVLASVLHLDNPTGNISYDEAKRIYQSLVNSKLTKGYEHTNIDWVSNNRTRAYISFASELMTEKYITEDEYSTVTRMLYSNDPETVKLAELIIEQKEKQRWEQN